MSTHLVGQVRPSQLIWTYGPGALVDLPNFSVVMMGLDRWDVNQCLPVEEARLLIAVRRVLGPQVARLRVPPVVREEGASPMTVEGMIGVPVRLFPRWLRCVKCGLLAEYDSGLFESSHIPIDPKGPVSSIPIAKKERMQTPFRPGFYWPVGKGTSMIFLGTGTYTGGHPNVAGRCDSLSEEHPCKPKTSGSNVMDAARRAPSSTRSDEKLSRTFLLVERGTRISTPSIHRAKLIAGRFCWERRTAGFPSPFRFWLSPWKKIQ
jgi:hypothetical protein